MTSQKPRGRGVPSPTPFSEEERREASRLRLFLHENLEVLVDDRHCEQNASAAPNGAEQIRHHRQRANAQASERRRRRNVTVQLMYHRRLAVPAHHHRLLLQLLRHLFQTNINPGF